MSIISSKRVPRRSNGDNRSNRIVRHRRVRNKVAGSAERPRLVLFRSSWHIYCQVVNDIEGHTMASASSLEKSVREKGAGKIGQAEIVGKLIAQRAKKAGVTQVVFDRGGYKYHGRVQSLANSARGEGLEF